MKLLKPAWVAQDDLPIFSCDIHPLGKKFATGGQGDDCGRVTIWNMEPILSPKAQKDSSVPKMLCQMDNHLACVNCVRWSSNGKYLASAGDDKLVMLWQQSAYGGGAVFGGGGKVNHESYRCAHTLRLHSGDVLDIAWSPDDSWLATASVDNTVIVWDVEKLPQTVAILKGHTGLVKGVTWDPVGKYLASQSDDKTLRVWRTTDWGLEAVVTEPFEDCGGTTHVLRLNWSPDGQYLVSAHAMNGGGPTAQILDREGWKFEKDFVGHRKAITCVRFNDNIFEKYRNDVDEGSGKKVLCNYVCLAIGSRDRSLSVWLTALKRPLFVVHDVFDSSILDLSWSKDGFVLIACSMDGSIAAVVMDKTELGVPMTPDKKDTLLKRLYGQSVGSMKQKPLLIEDPALLRVKENGDSLSPMLNGHHKSMDSIMPVKGPLDKQIEVRTTDGRRRITPMYLPPNIENGIDSQSSSQTTFGKNMMQSSSLQSKSKIKVERLDGVVDPNVSPGKNGTPTKPIIESHSQSSMPATVTPTPTVVKPNMIAIKRKPGNASANATTTATDSSDSQAKPSVIKPKSTKKKPDDDDDEKVKPVKKKHGVIESSSSESGDSSSDDSSGSSDDESASRTSKSDKSDHDKKSKMNGHDDRPKDVSMAPKPSVIAIKRKADDSPTSQPSVKKRGRPPKSSNPSTGTSTPVLSDRMTAPPATAAIPSLAPATPTRAFVPAVSRPSSPGLPPLAMANQRQIFNVKTNAGIQAVHVHNNIYRSSAGSVHRVYVQEGKDDDAIVKWEMMFPSPVVSVKGGCSMVIIACRDATIHLLSSSGVRLLPPLELPAPPTLLTVNNNVLACVTTTARLFLWQLHPSPRIIMEDKPVSPLHNHTSPRTSKSISSLSFTSANAPLISLSDGSSHTFSPEMGSWLQLVPPRSDLPNQPPTDLPHHPSSALPLASITPRPIAAPRLQPNISSACSGSAIESRLSSSKYLSSPTEYRYWLGCQVRYLTSQGQEAKLRTLLEDLMGPPSWTQGRGRSAGSGKQNGLDAMDTGEASGNEVVDNGNDWKDSVLGISKRRLLEDLLPLVASNLSLQRLYSEFRKQLDHIQSDSIDLFK